MLPDYSDLLKCPFCGEKKKVFSLLSGNTFECELWSDTRFVAPMLPEVSYVQKCNRCGKYYFKDRQMCGKSDDYDGDRGLLSYQEWKEAYFQMLRDNAEGAHGKHVVSDDDVLDVRFFLIWAYNDYYYRNDECIIPSEEEHDFMVGLIKTQLEATKGWKPGGLLLKAELYRESNQMDLCLETLKTISDLGVSLDKAESLLFERMREEALKGNDKVFIVFSKK